MFVCPWSKQVLVYRTYSNWILYCTICEKEYNWEISNYCTLNVLYCFPVQKLITTVELLQPQHEINVTGPRCMRMALLFLVVLIMQTYIKALFCTIYGWIKGQCLFCWRSMNLKIYFQLNILGPSPKTIQAGSIHVDFYLYAHDHADFICTHDYADFIYEHMNVQLLFVQYFVVIFSLNTLSTRKRFHYINELISPQNTQSAI